MISAKPLYYGKRAKILASIIAATLCTSCFIIVSDEMRRRYEELFTTQKNGTLVVEKEKHDGQLPKQTFPSASSTDRKPGPRAVLHVGPHKTGTTYIQDISRILADELVKDGYDMPWHNMDDTSQLIMTDNQVQFSTCFYNDGDGEKERLPCSEDLLESAHDIAKQNHSLFVSAESLSTVTSPTRNNGGLKRLVEFLEPIYDQEDVTIIISYRHYHDWLVSLYGQLKNSWVNWNKMSKDAFQANETDMLRPSIHDLLFNPPAVWGPNLVQNLAFSSIFERYNQHFDNVVVINFHDEETPLAEQFYCNAITDAPNTCEAVKKMVASPSVKVNANKASPSERYAGEDIVYAAHRRGLINVQTSEQFVKARTATFNHLVKTLGQTMSDLPLLCPSQDLLEDQWDFSMKQDKKYVEVVAKMAGESVGEYTADREAKLRAEFEVKMKSITLCNIDMEALFELSVWRDFFHSLKY